MLIHHISVLCNDFLSLYHPPIYETTIPDLSQLSVNNETTIPYLSHSSSNIWNIYTLFITIILQYMKQLYLIYHTHPRIMKQLYNALFAHTILQHSYLIYHYHPPIDETSISYFSLLSSNTLIPKMHPLVHSTKNHQLLPNTFAPQVTT